jgi:hypothetical protein
MHPTSFYLMNDPHLGLFMFSIPASCCGIWSATGKMLVLNTVWRKEIMLPHQISFPLSPLRSLSQFFLLLTACSKSRRSEVSPCGSGVGRMETVGSRRIERPQCATDIRNNWRQPVHFGISLQSQVAAFISGFVPSSTGGNAGGNEAFINSKILVECALRTSYRVQVGSQQ